MKRKYILLGVASVIFLCTMILAIQFGSYPVRAGELFAVIDAHINGLVYPDGNTDTIVWGIRLPRVLTAAMIWHCPKRFWRSVSRDFPQSSGGAVYIGCLLRIGVWRGGVHRCTSPWSPKVWQRSCLRLCPCFWLMHWRTQKKVCRWYG